MVIARGMLAAAVIGLLSVLVGCSPPHQEPISIATNQWPGYEPLYLARELGYLDRKEVRLVELPSASKVIQAFRSGTVQAAALTMDETLLLLQDGIPAKVVLVMDVSNGADAVIAHPGIETVADLRGKRIGVESFALGAYMLARTLEAANLKPSDVQIFPLTVDQHEEAFRNGRVDAVVTFEPVRTRLLQREAHILFDSSKIPNEIFDVLVVNEEYLARNPQRIDAIVNAWFRALDYLHANPEDAATRMARRLAISPDEFLKSLEGMLIPGREENRQLLEGEVPGIVAPARRMVEIMQNERLLFGTIDPTHLLVRKE